MKRSSNPFLLRLLQTYLWSFFLHIFQVFANPVTIVNIARLWIYQINNLKNMLTPECIDMDILLD